MTPATILAHDCIEQPVTEWALDYGITPGIIIARLERGVSIADAITMPMRTGHTGQRLPFYSRKQIGAKRIDGRIHSGRLAKTYTHDGMTLSIPEWSRVTGLKVGTIGARFRSGWDIGTALTTPLDGTRRYGPGVSLDFGPLEGTGGGSAAHEIPEKSFSDQKAPTA